MIPFNKPFLTGKETEYITAAVNSGKLSGNGLYTKKCQEFFETRYGFRKALMTTSCTDSLEMAAILCDIGKDDEIIAPSYTFVSTVLAFVRQGARIVFCDSCRDNPNIDADKIEELITPKTKAIVVVHYAGVACDMDKIMDIASRHNLLVVEDAAQAVDSYYKGRPLGSIGNLGCFSFHETKNIIAGEGGLLTVNDSHLVKRSEIIWEKGTNRSEFFRGEVNKYGWVDTGSSFLTSEIVSAFLWAQLENLDRIQTRRKEIWLAYHDALKPLADQGCFTLPLIPEYATNNAHLFYLVCRNIEERAALISWLKDKGIMAVFHYLSLHQSDFFQNNSSVWPINALSGNPQKEISEMRLPNCERFADCLVRLPLFFDLSDNEVELIISHIINFYNGV